MKKCFYLFLLFCMVFLVSCQKQEETAPEAPVQAKEEAETNLEEAPAQEEEDLPQESPAQPVNCLEDLWSDKTEELQAYAKFVDELKFEEGFSEMLLEYWLPITQYALLDINQDGIQELALTSAEIEYPDKDPLRNYFVYSYDMDTKEISLLFTNINYQGPFQYSPNYQALVYKGMMLFDLPEGVESLYELQQMGGLGEG